MSREKRNYSDLQEASEHLHYELGMLTAVSQSIASGISKEVWLKNALLESFVIHVRGLMDFFYNENPRKNDVVAEDYFDNERQWAEIRPALSELLKRAKQRAGKEVAHLTYARLKVTPETKPWQVSEIANEVIQVMTAFLKSVPKEKLSSIWQNNNTEI